MRPFEEKEEDRLAYSTLKEWNTDQGIDEKPKTIPDSRMKIDDPKGKYAEGGRIEAGKQEWGSKGQPKASDQLKIGESKWSQLDGAGKVAAGAGAVASVLSTLDMLTGGQDTILPGIGHTEVGYNPDMYIGRGV